MMMEHSEHKKYTAADIQRYHSCGMSYQEMYELEKAALEDPLLFDAIDGYENKKNIDSDLAALRNSINNRSKTKGGANLRKLYTSISIAASIVVICFVTFLIIKKSENKQIQFSANTNLPKQQASTVLHENNPVEQIADADNNTSDDENDTKNRNTVTEGLDNNNKPSGNFTKQEAEELASVLRSEKQKTRSTIIEKKDINLQPSETVASYSSPTVAESEMLNETNAAPATEAFAKKADTRKDNDSNIQPNANLAGSFSNNYVIADSTTVASVKFKNDKSLVSVTSKSVLPAAANIINNADMQTQELVVSGYASNRRKSANASTQKVTAKDLKKTENKKSNDLTVFDEYVSKHKTVCHNDEGNEIHGTVILTFRINKSGRPEKIKVKKSLHENCDKQAIQLLMNGPNWTNEGKKQTEVKINL